VTENLRARSATELVDAAVQLFRHNFRAILTVSGIGMAPYVILQPVIGTINDAEAGAMSGTAMFATLLAGFLTSLWFSLAGAAIIAAASKAYMGEHVDVGAAIGEVLARPLSILYGAIVKGLSVFLGLLLFLVGALYFYSTYFALPTTIVVEKLSGGQGVERARQLAAGYRWHAFKPLLLVWILYFFFSAAIGLLARMLFGIENVIMVNIFSTVLTIFVYPIVPITEMLVYYDLRIRKEGYDVQVMEQKLGPQVT
jgi:hypothetical protein